MSETIPDAGDDASYKPPVAVVVLLAILVIRYLGEAAYCHGSAADGSAPTSQALINMGGLSPALVAKGQWFRLLTAAFLHAGPAHLLFNGFAFWFAGSLEIVIGPAWLVAIFLLSAIGGSALSLLFSPDMMVSVGASGAILGVFGAQVVLGYMRYDDASPMRKRMTENAWSVLVPTLAQFAHSRTGEVIDFGAHLGGALTGAAIGLVLALCWPDGREAPPRPWPAWTVTGLGAAVLAWAWFVPLQMDRCMGLL